MNDKSLPTTPVNIQTYSQSHWVWSAILAGIVVITVAFRYALPIRDGDIWFHLLYGEYFWQNKTLIPDHTLFSWTPATNETIYCTWLSDIFFYFVHNIAGLTGLFAFRYFCIYLLVLACYLFAKKLKIACHPLTWLLCLLAVLMSYSGIFAKPEIFSFLFMSLLAWNWWYIRSKGDKAWKNCYLIPLVMLLWVNSHGGFVFGVIFLACIGIGEILNTRLSPLNTLSPLARKHFFLALIASLFVLFLTPYGYHYILYLVEALLPSKENLTRIGTVTAYLSPFKSGQHDMLGFVMLLNISVILLFYLYLRNFRKIEWSSLLANLAFIFLYTLFYRTIFYWAPVFLFSTLTLLSNKPLLPSRWKNRFFSLFLPTLTLGMVLLLSGITFHQSLYKSECWLGFGIGELNPVAETQYIKKYFPTAKIGNTYDEGSYLLWEIWPQNKVFVDARHFPYRNWYKEYGIVFHSDAIKQHPEIVPAFLQEYPCDLWLIGNQLPIRNYFLSSPDWQLAFYGKSACVFVRKDMQLPDTGTKFSSDLNTLKTLGKSIEVFTLTVYLKDWEATHIILKRMNEYFTYPKHKKLIQALERFLQDKKGDVY